MPGALAILLLLQTGECFRSTKCDDFRSTGREGGHVATLDNIPLPLYAQCSESFPMRTVVGTISVTRSGAAYCPKSDGTFVSMAANTPRVGRFGLLREGAATQLLSDVRDLSQASWTKSNMTCAKTATGADGVASSASTCTATAGNGTALQTYTAASAQRAASISIRRRTGTGTVEVTMDNGSTWCNATTALATAMANGCTWLRYAHRADDWHDTAGVCVAGCGAMTQTIANPVVGVRVVTSTDAIDVDFAQLEAGIYASTPINGASRAAEVVTISSPALGTSTGAVEFVFTPMWKQTAESADYRVLFDTSTPAGSTAGIRLYQQLNSTNFIFMSRDNSSADNLTASVLDSTVIPFGKPRLFRAEWSSNPKQFSVNAVVYGTKSASIVTPTAHGTAEVGAIYDRSLLAYGFFSFFAAPATVSTNRPTAIGTIGDSILVGAYDVIVVDAAQKALGLASRKQLTGYAVSGHTIAQCSTDYTNAKAGISKVVWNCGINTLLGGTDAATAWTAAQTVLDGMVTDGKTVLAVNLLPCKGYGTCGSGVQSAVTTYNASLAAWVGSNPSSATLLDMNTLLRNPGDTDSLKASCIDETGADFLHPDNSCTIEYAQAIAGAL